MKRENRKKQEIRMHSLVLLLSLISLSSAVIFDCTFTDERYGYGIDSYTCTGTASISGDSTTLREVRGNHINMNDNYNVEAVVISGHSGLTQLPKDLEKFFPNLVVIKWRLD